MTDRKSPTPFVIKKIRAKMELTQGQAAATIYYSWSAWQKWELGVRQMHPALWEFFLIKTRNYTLEYIK
jgi:DNA-binding transcriptional regulator YiaG